MPIDHEKCCGETPAPSTLHPTEAQVCCHGTRGCTNEEQDAHACTPEDKGGQPVKYPFTEEGIRAALTFQPAPEDKEGKVTATEWELDLAERIGSGMGEESVVDGYDWDKNVYGFVRTLLAQVAEESRREELEWVEEMGRITGWDKADLHAAILQRLAPPKKAR